MRTNTIHAVLVLAAAPMLAAAAKTGDIPDIAGRKSAIEPGNTTLTLEDLWRLPTLYKDDTSPFLNELRLVGRFHGDLYSVDSNLGADSDWIVRRLRAGVRARLFRSLELQAEADLSPQQDNPLYTRLSNAFVAWKFNDSLKLTVGKQSVKFTLDGATSTNELLTIDRNALTNNVGSPFEYISGIALSGSSQSWQYSAGYFSGGTVTKEFGNFDEGHFGLLSIGYDFARALGTRKALLRGDFVYNDRNPGSDGLRPFENTGSLVFQFDQGKWGASTDLSYATGFGAQSDVWGFVVMPWCNLTDKVQVVARYTHVESEGANGLRLSRYEGLMSSGRGDRYEELYAGLNYYLHGHKLKLQTGLAFSDMQDAANDGGHYHGWCWTTGVRISW